MDVIAERTLDIDLPGEPAGRILRVLLGRPERAADGSWRAPYAIHGPGDGEILERAAHGVDALQALALALRLLPTVLESYARRGRLTDHGQPGFDLGLP